MSSEFDYKPALAKFLVDLEGIPWFANIGKPLPAGITAKPLSRWFRTPRDVPEDDRTEWDRAWSCGTAAIR